MLSVPPCCSTMLSCEVPPRIDRVRACAAMDHRLGRVHVDRVITLPGETVVLAALALSVSLPVVPIRRLLALDAVCVVPTCVGSVAPVTVTTVPVAPSLAV